jgi:putative ABC transport system permease protein
MVFMDGRAHLVVGVYQAPPGEARLTRAIVVPYSECTAEPRPAWLTGAEAVFRTRIGAADQVGAEAPFALYPRDPQALVVAVPPELRTFRRGVERQTQALFIGLAAVSLLIGAIGIGNTTYVAVLERRGEIGLRRAVGASRSAVGAQFLVESGLSGVLGGMVGVVLGIDITAVTCLLKDWTVVFSPWLLAAGPLLGLVVGMLAGLYPAIAAARLAPVDALRG